MNRQPAPGRKMETAPSLAASRLAPIRRAGAEVPTRPVRRPAAAAPSVNEEPPVAERPIRQPARSPREPLAAEAAERPVRQPARSPRERMPSPKVTTEPAERAQRRMPSPKVEAGERSVRQPARSPRERMPSPKVTTEPAERAQRRMPSPRVVEAEPVEVAKPGTPQKPALRAEGAKKPIVRREVPGRVPVTVERPPVEEERPAERDGTPKKPGGRKPVIEPIKGSNVGVVTSIRKVGTGRAAQIVSVPRVMNNHEVELLNTKARYYFGKRNGIEFSPELGLEYNLRGLNESVPASSSTTARNYLERATPYSPFIIYEWKPMLGCTTLAFLESDFISEVHVFEPNDEYRAMLINNVDKYQLSDKLYVESGDFNLTKNPKTIGSVVYFNLNSVDELISGKTLQEWFKLLAPFVALIVTRLPTPTILFRPQEAKDWGGYEHQNTNTNQWYSTSNIITYVSMRAVTLGKEQHPTLVPDITEWRETVRQFMYQKFIDAGTPPKLANQYTEGECLEIWCEVFTTKYVDQARNLESKETIGDLLLKAAFSQYLFSLYPNISDSQLSKLNTRYMSEALQPVFAKREGFDQPGLIRTFDGRISNKILEDVFESFYGGLSEVGQIVGGSRGAGYDLVYDYLVNFLENLDYKIELITTVATGPEAVSEIKVILDKLGLAPKNIDNYLLHKEISKDGNLTTLSIRLRPEAMQKIEQEGIRLHSPLLAKGAFFQGESEKDTRNDVYLKAYQVLEEQGVDMKFADQIKYKREFMHPNLKPFAADVEKKAKREGYDHYYIRLVNPDAVFKTYQLIGVGPDRSEYIMAEKSHPNPTMARQELLKTYLVSPAVPLIPKTSFVQ